MANNEEGLNIPIGAYADGKSVEKAVKDITNKVDNSLKNGRIDIPVNITTPIDKTKPELLKAQKAITEELTRVMTEGFSMSEGNLDSLTKKLIKFNEVAKASGKDKRNPIVREINDQIKNIEQQYKEFQRIEKDIVSSLNINNKKITNRKISSYSSGNNLVAKKGTIDLSNMTKEVNNAVSKISSAINSGNKQQSSELQSLSQATSNTNSLITTQTNFDKIENVAERGADSAASQKNQNILDSIRQDLGTGFNTEANASTLIQEVRDILSNTGRPNKNTEIESTYQTILEQIRDSLKSINDKIVGKMGSSTKSTTSTEPITRPRSYTRDLTQFRRPLPVAAPTTALTVRPEQSLVVQNKEKSKFTSYYEGTDIFERQRKDREIATQKQREEYERQMSPFARSVISTTRQDPSKPIRSLIDEFIRLTGVVDNYKTIMARTSEEQDKLAAERISTYGLYRGRDATDTGDKTYAARSMSLWRTNSKVEDMFKDLRITEGVKIDTTKITESLAKALSQSQMFNAQTGGVVRNIFGAMTGYLGMPSLEKSRSQADALNQIMANMRESMNKILNDIQNKESVLSGMKERGELKLDDNGKVLDTSTKEAMILAAQLEESKIVLSSALADVRHVNEVVDKTGGNVSKIVQQLGFTSPILRDNNNILANINAGLDKNGKALKFQTRTAEVLNYSLQSMARYIGNMWKNWMLQLNPITQIKRLFTDFTSYDVKWQRTMNVIKYNLRAIVRPMMEGIAQIIVNIIGFLDIISMKIQSAFGKLPVSLFDQAAAASEKMREELEAAANVTAGFDELHDIGTQRWFRWCGK